MTDEELMQQALEAMEAALGEDEPYFVKCGLAIVALRERLAQPDCNSIAITKMWFDDGKIIQKEVKQGDVYKPSNFDCPRCGHCCQYRP